MSELVDALITIVLFIVVLGGIVLFHELGHFVSARLAGVRVLEFGIGFPPRAAVLRRRGETLYTLNWLPIGGFVKLEDEDGGESDDPRSFPNARLLVKLGILAAGVLMNLVLAFAIFTAIAWLATPFVGLRFAEVEPASPAAQAGLQPTDAIISLDGQPFDFYGTNMIDILRGHAGQTVTLGVIHGDGSRGTLTATLRSPAAVEAGNGALGIRAGSQGFQTLFYGEYTSRPLGDAVRIGADETGRWFGLILEGLRDLAGSIVANPTAAPPVQGPVGIATSLGDVFRGSGPIMTLYVAGILSANLALVNVLPFPPLDGGRMLVLVLKAVPRYGTRISLRAERLTYAIGFVALFAFLIWVTVFDVARQLGGGAP